MLKINQSFPWPETGTKFASITFQVICKKDGVIKLYCKGADTTVYEYLDAKCSDLQELTTSHLNVSYFWLLTKIT